MNKAYETGRQMGPYPPLVSFLVLAFFPIVGIAVLMLGIWVMIEGVKDGLSLVFVILSSVLMIGSGVFCLILGWAFISKGMAEYKICSDGLWAKYPLEKPRKISWEEFQQVCVCYAAYTTRGERRANKVLCCVMKGEKKNIYGRWKTDNPFRYRSVITMNYTIELHEGIKENCPFDVVDFRKPWEIKQFEYN